MKRALILALALGCAKSALDLTPFPCAADQGCPSGTSCLPGTGCVSPALDAVCASKLDCPAGSVCDSNRCSPTCTNGTGCPSGRACSTSTGAGVCLTSCTTSSQCPNQLSCEPLRIGAAASVCLPKGAGFGGTCTGADGAACGPAGSGLICSAGFCTSGCSDGSGCPTGFVCSGPGAGACLPDCTAGQACTTGLACAGLWYGTNKACLPSGVGLDLACSNEGQPCGGFGANAVCAGGACVPRSDAAGACASGRVGLIPGPTGCVPDCGAGQACPGGTTCNDLWHGGAKGCTATAPKACATTASPAGANNCALTCGAANFAVHCPNSTATCPVHSYCTSDNRCSCVEGYSAVTCAGAACTGSCSYPNWYCVPAVSSPATLSCTDPPASAGGTCTCIDGRQFTEQCAALGYTCEYLCSIGCDPVLQNCPAGPKSVCHINGSGGVPACLLPGGSDAVGSPCTYTDTTDSCAAGGDCDSTLATTPGTGVCRKFCKLASDCGANNVCLDIIGNHSPLIGYCIPTSEECAPFTGCPAGASCDTQETTEYVWVPVCHKYGTKAAGASCAGDLECGANMECVTTAQSGGARVCSMLCDSTHACAGGLTCKSFNQQPYTTFGVCQ